MVSILYPVYIMHEYIYFSMLYIMNMTEKDQGTTLVRINDRKLLIHENIQHFDNFRFRRGQSIFWWVFTISSSLFNLALASSRARFCCCRSSLLESS